MQVVQPWRLKSIRTIDISTYNDDEVSKALKIEQTRSFDLSVEPGWRVCLFQLSGDEYILSIVMHHIVSDGWSVDVLRHELDVFYSAALKGDDPLSQITPLPIQYRDFAAWQKQPEQALEQDKQLKYWTKQLANSTPAEFLCDKPRPEVLSGEAGVVPFTIVGALYESLQAYCLAHQVTSFVVLLAAFRATHYRLTGTDDATIGMPTANRNRPELENLIGFFVNTQCIRTAVTSNQTFEGLVQQTRDSATEAFANQDVPFEQLVSALLPGSRDTSRNPLVQLLFAVHTQRDLGQLQFEGLQAELIEMTPTSRLDMEFHFFQEDDCLHGSLLYSTDIFEPETVKGLLLVFNEILRRGLEESALPIATLPLTDGFSELRRLNLLDIEKTPYPRDSSIVDVFREQVAVCPEAMAIKDSSSELTYSELDRQSERLAAWLCQRRMAPETLVGVLAPRSCHTIVAFLGILKAGLAYLPLDVNVPVARTETILSAVAGHKLVLLGSSVQAPEIAMPDVEMITISDTLKYSDTNVASIRRSSPSATSLAYVIFTSGSTGKPKGVQLEHRSIVRLIRDSNLVSMLPPSPRTAHLTNIAFDVSVWEICLALLNGGSVICIENPVTMESTALQRLFAEEKIQTATLSPALLKRYLADMPDLISGLDILFTSGDRLDSRDAMEAQALVKGGVYNAYGPTENHISTIYYVKDKELFTNGVPIGRSVSNSGAVVMDTKQQLVSIGVIGELVLTGDGLARGYTDLALDINRFVDVTIDAQRVKAYRTGDRVRFRPQDGQIEFFGRIDQQVKIRGYRVELAEVEHAMLHHSAVSDAAVVVSQRDGAEQELVAFVVCRGAKDSEPERQVNKHLQAVLPAYMVPAQIIVLSQMPINANGKVDRKELGIMAQTAERKRRVVEHVAPCNAIESALCEVFAGILGVEVGATDDFFELGGHSLTAMKLAAQLGRRLKTMVSVRDIFNNPVLADLATTLQQNTEQHRPIPSSKYSWPVEQSFAQGRLWFLDQFNLGSLCVLYATDLFETESINGMLSVFYEILRRCLEEPKSPIATLPLTDGSELRDLSLLDIPRTEYPRESSVVDVFRDQVAAYPETIAVKDSYSELTYAELDSQSSMLAAWLCKREMAPESLVGVIAPRSCQTIVAYLGILKAGLTFLPLDINVPAARIGTILSAVPGRKLVLTGPNISVSSYNLPDTEMLSIADALQHPIHSSHNDALVHPSATSLAYVIFTSGSTGKPKGVMIEHRGIVRLVKSSNVGDMLPREFRVAHLMNIAFDLSIWEIFAPLLNGGTLVCIDYLTILDSKALADAFAKEQIRVAMLPSLLVKQCLDSFPASIAALDYLYVGADRLDGRDAIKAQSLVQRGVINAYGPTENAMLSTIYKVRDVETFVNGVPIGKPVSNSGAYVMDAKQQLVPTGVVGELVVTGDGVARGYIDATLNVNRFVDVKIEGQLVKAYRTGDKVRYRPQDGEIEFFGRIDHQVKIRGHRVELPEIEHAILNHAAILDAAVVLRGQGAEQEVFAFAVANADYLASMSLPDSETVNNSSVAQLEKDVYNQLKTVLPGYMVPERVVILERMPINENGKTVKAEQTRPFDLTTEPGWRVCLFRIAKDDHILSIVMHHVASDGWSADVLRSELDNFYAMALAGEKDPLSQIAPLPVQYRDFAVWQKQPEQLAEQQRQLEYWTTQLADSAPAELLCDRPRPEVLSGEAGAVNVTIAGSLYDSLQAYCRAQNVTPFVVLLAAFRATHYRLTGAEDATIGTPTANRNRPELENLIGFFVNTQCMRITITDDIFDDLVQQVRNTATAAFANQDVPFEQIVSALLPGSRDVSRNPLVQLMFAVHSQRDLGKLRLKGLQDESVPLTPTTRFDVEFHLFQDDNRLTGGVLYATDLFDVETINSMLAVFNEILRRGLDSPQIPVATLPLTEGLSDLRSQGLLDIEKPDYPRELSIVEVFRDQVATCLDVTAVKDTSTELTYAALDRQSNKVAMWLCQRQMPSETLVGVYAPRSCDTIVVLLGILKAGLSYLPLDVNIPAARIKDILSAVEGHKLILLGSDTTPPDVVLPDLEIVQINKIKGHAVTTTKLPSTSATNLAYVIFTSGSTGKPKGVMIEHRSVIRLVKNSNVVSRLPQNAQIAHLSNLAFDASTWEIYAALLNGGTIICIDYFTSVDVKALRTVFAKEHICATMLPPALLKQVLAISPDMLRDVDLLFVAGDRLEGQDAVKAQALVPEGVYNAYGPTENAVLSTIYNIRQGDQFVGSVPIGRPVSNSGAFVMDRQQQLVSGGVIGELIVTGDGLARGYTDSKLDVNRFVNVSLGGNSVRAYRTGDRVRIRPKDGQIEFLGRMDYQIKIRGHRIEPAEIEHAILRCYVADDAAVVINCQEGQEPEMVGFVAVKSQVEIEIEENENENENKVTDWADHFELRTYEDIGTIDLSTVGRDFMGWTS
ncbi:acetyl-CoA synthetase-like protein, partial [Lindgomyces ingoldianus]